MRRSTQQGFTLIELLVVIVIIGLLSATVLLTMRDPRGGLSDDADRFAGRVRAAHDRAVVLARPVAVWVSASGYGFEERRDGRWTPIADRLMRPADWSGGAAARLTGGRGRIAFDTVGRADQPLGFVLAREGHVLGVTVGLDGKVQRRD